MKSTLKEEAKVEFSFDLPPQVVLLERVIEVQGSKETRKIEVKVARRKDGSSSVVFGDALLAGSLARYSLPIMYKSGDGKGQVKTVIQPLDEKTAASVTALEALTWYEFHPDLVVPVITSVAHSRYVDDLPEGEPIK